MIPMYDIIVIGAGVAGLTFAFKTSKYAEVLLLEARNRNELSKGTKVFPEHNRPFIKEVDWTNKEIFPRIHEIIRYLGTKEEGILQSNEFGSPFGNICYIEKLSEVLIKKIEAQSGQIKFNEKINKIIKYNDYIEVINNIGESYKTKLLALATGSHNFELQKSVGFDIPDTYTGIFSHMYGDEDKINVNLPIEYNFHINSKISTSGPFFICKGLSRIFLGFLGTKSETEQELYSKYERIIQNYKKIQPYIDGLKPDKPILTKISKHPIKSFSQNRIIILGEAAGLVTSFFYEGLIAGLASAELSAQTIRPLLENGSSFGISELKNYDSELNRIILQTYFKNDNASEYLFYNSPSQINLIFNTYAKLMHTNKKIRKYIWDAHITHHLEDYDTKRDRWVGEQLFKKLPTLSKLVLGIYLKPPTQ